VVVVVICGEVGCVLGVGYEEVGDWVGVGWVAVVEVGWVGGCGEVQEVVGWVVLVVMAVVEGVVTVSVVGAY
jgi:hypothetical protein